MQMSSVEAPQYFRSKCLGCHTQRSCTLDLQKRLVLQPADACASCHMPKRPALTVSHAALTDHRILRTPDEPYPDSAFRESLPGTGLIHVNAVPGKPDTVPGPLLLNAYRQEIIRSHLEYKDDYFSLLDRLSKSANKDPFVLSAMAQKAASDGDLPKAIDYARQVIDRGSGSVSDYLLLDIFLGRSGDLEGCIQVLEKGISVAPYSNFLYENLAIRQLSSGHVDDGLETLRKGLELFPEDSALQNMKQQAAARGLLH
jgi:tetratricopeptide (TPR) repeat protein